MSNYITDVEWRRIKRRCLVFAMRFDLSVVIDRLLDRFDLLPLWFAFSFMMEMIIGDD